MASAVSSGQVFQFGLFEANVAHNTLTRKGVRVKIQEQPFSVLVFLLEHPGEIVTREELRQKLWPEGTYVDFDGSLNVILKKLRAALDDDADNPTFVETVPKKGYRFIAPVTVLPSPIAAQVADTTREPNNGLQSNPAAKDFSRRSSLYRWGIAAAVLIFAIAAGYRLLVVRKVHALKNTDTIVVADFTNDTGDPVFDESLKQALSLQLSQSPFLSLIPDGRVRGTMRQMGLSATDFISTETARKICLRTNSAAVIDGSIRTTGSEYILGVRALSCETGDSLAQEEARVSRKDDVLPALDRVSSALRTKVGEPLLSVAKYDIPIYPGTTGSLEALRAYSLGSKMELSKGAAASIPFYQHALEMDPNFTLAASNLGISYHNSGEVARGAEYLTRAFQHRDRVSERERFQIESAYYSLVTGEMEKADTIYEVWAQTYPRDPLPHHNWSSDLASLGQYDKAVSEAREALRLTPVGVTTNTSYASLQQWLTTVDRLDEAKAMYTEARAKNIDNNSLHWDRYSIAFLENDQPEMQKQLQWASGKAGVEDILLLFQSDTEAYQGHWRMAESYLSQAADSDRRHGLKETMALIQVSGALRAAEFGFMRTARQQVRDALANGDSRDIQILGALALARIGDHKQALLMADRLNHAYPLDTLTQSYWLPVIRATVKLGEHEPSQALNELEVSRPYELGTPDTWFEEGGPLFPVYLRGEAYLQLGDGSHAAEEFRKYFEHRGVVQNCYLGAFARVGMARAFVVQGDSAHAQGAYQDFLNLWKDADDNVPILKEARNELEKLQ